MRGEEVQLLIAALVSTLGPGRGDHARRPRLPLAGRLAHGVAKAVAPPLPGRLYAQVRRAMLQAMQLTLQCYGAWRDASIVIDAELRKAFAAAAQSAVTRAIEKTGCLCEPAMSLAAVAALPADLDAYEPAALAAFVADTVESELLAGIGETDMPLSFRDFLRGAGTGAPSWHDAFIVYFAWEAKNDLEPLSAVLSAADPSRHDLARLHDDLLARAPEIAQRFDAFLKSTREASSGDVPPYRLTERARFVDLAALQAWHLAGRVGVPAPALVAALEPICRAVGAPVDVETELHQSAARLATLWARMHAAVAGSPPIGEAANALAQGDLAAAQQALTTAFARAATAAERAEVRQLEGGLQSLAGLWRHASRSYMAAADLLKGEFPEASLGVLIEVVHAFIQEAERTGDARAAETGSKLAENIVARVARANPALRAEAGLAQALAHIVHLRTSGQTDMLPMVVRFVRRSVPINALRATEARADRAIVRISEELARAVSEAGDDTGEGAAAVELVSALRAERGATLTPRDDALLLACLAEMRALGDKPEGETGSNQEAVRLLADALARVSRVDAPYLWSTLHGRLGQMLWSTAEPQEGEANRATRKSALLALERALQECGHDRGGPDAVRHLMNVAKALSGPRTETSSGPPSERAVHALRSADALLSETTPTAERLQVTQQLATTLSMAGRHASARSPRAARVLFEEAIAGFRRAASLAEGDDSRRGLVRLLLSLGRTISLLAEIERSRPRYEEAIAVYERVLELTADRKRQTAQVRAEEAIAELSKLIDVIRRAEGRISHAQ